MHARTSNCAKGCLGYLYILSCLSFGQRCRCQTGWVILERGLRRDLCSESNVVALYNSHCARGPHRAVFVSAAITKRAPQTQDEWDGSRSLFSFLLGTGFAGRIWALWNVIMLWMGVKYLTFSVERSVSLSYFLWVKTIVKTAWERLLVSFMLVAATVLRIQRAKLLS